MALPLRLSADDLVVEAGGTVEATVGVGPLPEGAGGVYHLWLRGLPSGWYSLSASRLELSPDETRTVLLVVHPPQADPTADRRHHVGLVEVGDGTAPPTSLPLRLRVDPPAWSTGGRKLLGYLPRLYRDDDFLGRLLLIFQSVLDPIEQRIDDSDHYLDPSVTPDELLPWLASWLGIAFTPGMSPSSQRELLLRAVELYRWKGTGRALRQELALRTGGRSLVVENFDGLRLGHDAALGVNTALGERRDGHVVVTLALPDGAGPDEQARADRLVRELKPPHVDHVVRTVAAG
jgi:phage tail-like protein